ncbi:MAG: hybrid sensor histidine kinase/response regulator [Desulfobulbaceae bacterium]|nr:MAG: hybrid sensor histidine kinase/response regulator [Desulfobulbaceae bacterium]
MTTPPSYQDLLKKNQLLEKEAANRIRTILALEEDIEKYQCLIEHARELIHSVKPDGTFLYVNQAWKNALGYSDADLKELKLLDIVDKECRASCRAIFQQLISGDNIDRNETVFVTKNGRKLIVEGQCTTHFQDGKAVRMTGFFRDISERSRNEAALRESEMRYRTLFENAHDLIQLIRPDGKLLYVNDSWRRTFGYSEEEVEDLSIFDLIAPDCLEHCRTTFSKVITEEKTHYINTVFADKNGKKVIIEGNAICKFENGSPLYTQCIFRDITEKKRMEEELIKAHKLESVGVFAGGIAHDFNNLLQAIIGNISLAKMYINPEDKAYERLERTEKASLLAQNLTQQLLTFSKGGEPIKTTTTISDILKDATDFSLRGSKIKCHYQLADNLLPVEADKGQLSQVAQNLAINAGQAMPEGGILTIKAANVDIADDNIFNLPAGKYIEIIFQDQGNGISKKDIGKIFDPYFSKKKTGSGLGLAITYSIIANHGGHISVESEPNHGTTFTIHLPASSQDVVPEEEHTLQTTAQHGRLLLMDDEEIILEVLGEMLSFLGCQADSVKDGHAAVERYDKARKAGTPYTGVIMDLTIPGGMGGRETLAALKEIDPQIRALASSGYANDPIMANFKEYGFCGVIPKPYKVEELSKAISLLFADQTNQPAPAA